MLSGAKLTRRKHTVLERAARHGHEMVNEQGTVRAYTWIAAQRRWRSECKNCGAWAYVAEDGSTDENENALAYVECPNAPFSD